MVYPLLLAAASAFKAAGSIMGGYSRASEMKQEAENQRLRARAIKLQGLQDGTSRAREFESALQNILALRGARNVGFDSPSAIAADKALAKQSRENILTSQLGFMQEADVANRNSVGLRKGARRAITAGYLSAIPDLIDAAGTLKSSTPKKT